MSIAPAALKLPSNTVSPLILFFPSLLLNIVSLFFVLYSDFPPLVLNVWATFKFFTLVLLPLILTSPLSPIVTLLPSAANIKLPLFFIAIFLPRVILVSESVGDEALNILESPEIISLLFNATLYLSVFTFVTFA